MTQAEKTGSTPKKGWAVVYVATITLMLVGALQFASFALNRPNTALLAACDRISMEMRTMGRLLGGDHPETVSWQGQQAATEATCARITGRR